MADEEKKTDPQGVTPGAGNEDANGGNGNGTPDPASNDAPTPNEAETKAAEEKAAADKVETDKAETEKADAEKLEADKAAAAKDDTVLDADVWGSTGSDVGDSVLTMLQNADVSVDDAKALLFDAVQAGDVTKIDAAALEAKVGKTKATLIMAGITTFVGEQATRNSQIVADIKEASGGEENWTKMTAWTKGKDADGKPNVSDADLTEYRGMIDKGGAMARFAVSEIAAKYNADKANTTLESTSAPKPMLGDGGPGQGSRATSKAEYVAELTKAHRKGASETELAEITAARHLGRSQGK